ncbi:MAG: anaerobic ribonucleoside-triphosphate reductase activating protein [Elusimicrobiaceae bacterium]
MKIGGLTRFSLIDYPGHIAAVVFLQGCNFRCPFCHNPELVYPEKFAEPLPEETLFSFLLRRRGQLDGVVITGGEPSVQVGLPAFIARIKELGYKVKLDTNGSNPALLKRLFDENALDFIAMDLKAQFLKYPLLTGTKANMDAIGQSVELIKNSGVKHEFRITFDTRHLTQDDLASVRQIAAPDPLTVNECILRPEKSV